MRLRKRQKSYPNIVRVASDMINDNSVIVLSSKTIELLAVGDIVNVKSKKKKQTVLVVQTDSKLKECQATIGSVVKKNLRVHDGDILTLHACEDIDIAKSITILPAFDKVEDIAICSPNILWEMFLVPYFHEAYRPVCRGNIFTTLYGTVQLTFKIVDVKPKKYGIVTSSTEIQGFGIENWMLSEGDLRFSLHWQSQIRKVIKKILPRKRLGQGYVRLEV